MPIIDCHVHAGDKYGPVENVIAHMDANGVTHAVIVQHMGQTNNTYLRQCIDKYPQRFWGICMVDLTLSNAPKILRSELKENGLHGVRLPAMSLSRRPDLWEMAVECKAVISVLGLQPHDLGQVERLRAFLEKYPTARLKIEHLGYPEPSEPPPYATYQRVMDLSQFKGVFLQFSSPYTQSKKAYPYDDLLPFIEMAKQHFAPNRIVWGSCYPPVEKYMTYAQSLAWLGTLGLKDTHRDNALWQNAVRLMDPRKKKVVAET